MATACDFPFESAKPQIYRWAYRLLRNHQDALDATQSVLMKALQGLPLDRARQDAWMRRVTINHCFDILRRHRELPGNWSAASRDRGPAAECEDAERRDRICDALQQLTAIQRLVLLAKTYDDESFEAIASSMGISASSVKTHYTRAVRKMRDLLTGKHGAEV